ncbi:Response regulator receiver domain-containing protein [Fodinibius salinus]|uniref:Response regulator receiver domain-containing protein n=1 Tax=Fodinibius salinus TaxID=860790 RepID=A0A5D3YJH9_9BACT|nr:response regulator [Fodinibius salinus]TYP93668.1 Response regulator receiver domain-containing protein [Fodinibius salinus]
MKQQCILIIDKEEAIRESFQLVLQEEGYCCFIAKDLTEAKQILAAETVDILLIDSLLVRSPSSLPSLLSAYPEVGVIVMGGYAEIEVMQRTLSEGAHDFIIKPMEFAELIHKVSKYSK